MVLSYDLDMRMNFLFFWGGGGGGEGGGWIIIMINKASTNTYVVPIIYQ